MPGNSQRKGAVRKKGKTTPAGSGGRVRRGLEGKGPTPKAEDRPYHKSFKKRRGDDSSGGGRPSSGGRGKDKRPPKVAAGSDWVIGRNPVYEALRAGLPVRRAYVADGVERDDRLRDIFQFAAENGIVLLSATRPELDRLTGGGVHQGVALQLPPYEYADPAELMGDAIRSDTPGLIVALDGITDPRNLGAIIRSVAAFGGHGVIIPERRSAQMTAAAWKTSAGAAVRVPVARCTNLNRVLQSYAKAGFTVIGLAGEGETDISEVPDLDGPVLIVVGSEDDGLARLVRTNCDYLARIPINSEVESLNASVAAAIALYEVTRFRG
ncbi:MAG: 23S rRNA (guanosine(2251)-2'-O)-methyltransferase RlmB [Micropruina sp.]|jgi:23S rRNA (guanosine2251-2'-O)-methyltransferase|nr:23S rRNA (guanosine(2251)-2'-O)-methyltransferase RlmB [Micropruina sp.]HBX83011.1 23S rRNA (guanosine(2251)-2'-O)-methyltransferase RlmB [Propionibacteriaceae bacterium]